MEERLDESTRAYLKPKKLSYWIGRAIKLAGGQRKLSKRLKINQNNIYGYFHGKTLSIRGDILLKIMKFLEANDFKIKNILRDMEKIERVYDYRKITVKKARKGLIEKYGKNAFNYLHQRSKEKLIKKYGKKCMKILSKRGHEKLLEKYGKDTFKIITRKGYKAMGRKYGKDWRKVIGRISYLKCKEKLGEDYLRKRIAKKHEREPLTNQENGIVKLLNKEKIGFSSHSILDNYLECDFLIPNNSHSKICIEVSLAAPQPSNLYRKIAQVLVRKKRLINCQFIILIPISKKTEKQTWHARPDLIKFLLDNNIIVFWNKEEKKLIQCIKLILQNQNMNHFIKEKLQWCRESMKKRKRHALQSAKQETSRLNNHEKRIIKLLNLKGSKKILFNKYGWPIVPDVINKDCLYEITSATTHSALETIAGKIYYLSKTLPKMNIKLIIKENKKFPSRELIEKVCKIVPIEQSPIYQ